MHLKKPTNLKKKLVDINTSFSVTSHRKAFQNKTQACNYDLMALYKYVYYYHLLLLLLLLGGSVAEWLACWTQALKGPGSNRSRDAVG